MPRSFTLKLAVSNLKKNRKLYMPYIIASILMIAVIYIMSFLSNSKDLANFRGANYVTLSMLLGNIIVSGFAIIFSFYINSFLMKQRSKEFGLYNILGMEKRHLGRVLVAESMISSTISIIMGLGVGILFSKLALMVITKMIGAGHIIAFEVNMHAVTHTAVFFAIVFALVLIKNILSIRISKPIEMLKGASAPEREPKAKIILSLIGAACLVAGYVISISIKDPLAAIILFFVAVILVIIGTYLLFTTVSIAVLKALKKNKRFYYKKANFTSISGILFRMKQNAVGMANICILSTMVIVMVSVTVSLRVGINDVIKKITPSDVIVSVSLDGEQLKENGKTSNARIDDELKLFKDKVEKQDIKLVDTNAYVLQSYKVEIDEASQRINFIQAANKQFLTVMTADQYEKFSGKKISVSKNEAISIGTKLNGKLDISGINLDVKQMNLKVPASTVSAVYGQYVLIVHDDEIADAIAGEANKYSSSMGNMLFMTANIENRDEVGEQKYAALSKCVTEYWSDRGESLGITNVYNVTRYEADKMLGGLTNSFLFLGAFLGVVFAFAAALIIYYKQISEGYYDKDKFDMMQKVGMSEKDVRQTIRKQITFVFFAPLIVAILHVAGAFNMIRLILEIFSIFNIGLLIECTVICVLAFAILYAVIFAFTAREYYRIVRRKI